MYVNVMKATASRWLDEAIYSDVMASGCQRGHYGVSVEGVTAGRVGEHSQYTSGHG